MTRSIPKKQEKVLMTDDRVIATIAKAQVCLLSDHQAYVPWVMVLT